MRLLHSVRNDNLFLRDCHASLAMTYKKCFQITKRVHLSAFFNVYKSVFPILNIKIA